MAHFRALVDSEESLLGCCVLRVRRFDERRLASIQPAMVLRSFAAFFSDRSIS